MRGLITSACDGDIVCSISESRVRCAVSSAAHAQWQVRRPRSCRAAGERQWKLGKGVLLGPFTGLLVYKGRYCTHTIHTTVSIELNMKTVNNNMYD